MVKFSFFCVEQVYHGKNPCGLRFLGRDKERKKIDITVEGPRPYFYILTSEKERIGTFPCILEDGFKSMYGDELTRVSLSNPWDIKDLVKNFSKTFEADVPYPTRVLIDKDIYTGIEVTDDGDIKHCDIDCEPRIMNLDVETDYQGGSNKDMMRPLIAISFYDNYTDTIYSLSYKEIPETYQKRYSYKSEVLKNSDGTFKDVKVVEIAVEGEVELLNLFKAYVKNFDVDVFTGWNINFDMIYILRRMETLNLDPDSLSPVGKYTWDTGDANGSNRGPRKQYVDNSGNFRDVPKKTRKFGSDSKKAMIRGRTIIDILKGYRRMKWKGVEGFKLDSVAKKEFGVGKIEYKGWMSDFWKNDFNNFIKYNIRDVEMCLAIDKKYSVIDSLLNIRKISGCEMSDILQNSRIFDVYILRYCLGKFVLPTKKYSSEGAQKIEGGFVLEPKVGLHKYVAVLDLKGLYPSIMLSFNMSPETVDNRGDIIVGNGVRFKRETGILKDILVDLIKKRDELRAMLKTPEVFNDKDKYTNIYKRQYYYKTFSNSSYGITLYPGFRLFNPAIGSSITFIGRFLANKIRELCESKGYTVVRQDSITGDRFTVIRKNGIVLVKSFEELWDMTSRKVTRTDGKQTGYFSDVIECLSENIEKHTSEWKKINYVIKHNTSKQIYRLFNSYGETQVTSDHSCFNKDGVLQRSKDLDSFYRLSNIPKLPKSRFLKKIKLSDYSEYLKCDDSIIIQNEYDVDSDEFKSLMRIIGAYIAEGSCSFDETSKKYRMNLVKNTRGQIQIGNQDRSYLDIIQKDVKKISNTVCNISGGDVVRYRPDKKTKYHKRGFKLRLSRSKWPTLLRDLCGYKSNGKKLPDFFFNLPKHIQDECLKMMYKGDGHVIRDNCQCYTTKSHKLMSGLTYIWKERGMNFHFRSDDRNNKSCHSIRQHKSNKLLNHNYINKQVLNGYSCVYDLNVEDNHNFYDMLGGVLLHNTDSAFVITGKDTLEEAVKVGKELEDEVNNMFSTWFKGMNNDISYMSIKCEKIYGLMFSGAEKKLYAGKIDWDWEKGDISTKPDIEIKGFATVKSDRSMFSRTLQKKIFNMIFEGKTNEDIKKFILDEIDKFHKLEYDWEYIGIPKAITKDLDEYGTKNPWITGVKWSQENLTGFQFSPKPYLLYLCPSNKYNTTSICYNNENEVPDDLPIDMQRMMEVCIYKVVEKIIDVLGIDSKVILNKIRNKAKNQIEITKWL